MDWGCGDLAWSIALFPESEITGVEVSDDNLKKSHINAEHNGIKFIGLNTNNLSLLNKEYYDTAISMGLIELISDAEFENVFSNIHRAMQHEGILFCTFHNWRLLSALYLPWIFKGGYKGYVKNFGFNVKKMSIYNVELALENIGFKVVCGGGFNPYPRIMWKWMPGFFYLTKSKFLSYFYCTQFLILEKVKIHTKDL